MYDVEKYSVFSLFSIFLKLNYDSEVYVQFRQYVEESDWLKKGNNFYGKHVKTYFSHASDFHDYFDKNVKTSRYKHYIDGSLMIEWYKFLYLKTNLPIDLKTTIQRTFLNGFLLDGNE
ncbi:MAG: hypothetical protein MJ221_04375 [Bacilli bacterium]|nr:hypothetical protein [Bacilli bacterium]